MRELLTSTPSEGRWRGGSLCRTQVARRVEVAARGAGRGAGPPLPRGRCEGQRGFPEDAAQHILHMSSEEEEV